jgi:hypothetical protein
LSDGATFDYDAFTAWGASTDFKVGGTVRDELWGRQPSPRAAALKVGVYPDISMQPSVENEATKERVNVIVRAGVGERLSYP